VTSTRRPTSYKEHVLAGNVPGKGEDPDEHAREHFKKLVQDHPQHARPAPRPLSTHDLKRRSGARW